MFYMKIVGAEQGAFHSDSPRAGDKGSLCLGFKFRGEAPNDQRRGSTQVGPITVIKAWGPSSPQILAALWHGEVLTEVTLEFVRPNDKGAEMVFETIVLKNASVASVERRVGQLSELVEGGVHRDLEEIGLRYESMEVKHKADSGHTVVKYDWRHRQGR
jgi:type VI secretion system Hcp family effector